MAKFEFSCISSCASENRESVKVKCNLFFKAVLIFQILFWIMLEWPFGQNCIL